jgi:serine/threonine-protein kinase PknK
MDAAIALTRAERGFLLIGDAPFARRLRVAVARNIDREKLRGGHLKFSRTIAERVVRTGEPVVAVDAQADERFARARSVHSLGLTSVLSVPVRSPEGVLGAIYVDQRFRPASFGADQVELLSALADQAAIALGRSRLVEELRAKTRELETKNAEVERLAERQAREIVRLMDARPRRRAGGRIGRHDYSGLVCGSPSMRRVLEITDRVIDADVTVLLRGESGTGKERFARAIHDNGPRARRPFVAINCGALPESLLEAELFGYQRGAFSGAVRDHPGLFVAAQGGTLLLDELGDMPLSMQVKLLRALQEREIRPLGASATIPVDVRVIAATHKDLQGEIEEGRFREDLYYRVAVVEIVLPPLRERLEDLLPLAEQILERVAVQLGRPRKALERSAERALLSHPFPGNVRELENALTKAFLMSEGPTLRADDLALGHARSPDGREAASAGRRRVGRERIVATLESTEWNVAEAARALAIPRATFYRMLGRLGLRRGA